MFSGNFARGDESYSRIRLVLYIECNISHKNMRTKYDFFLTININMCWRGALSYFKHMRIHEFTESVEDLRSKVKTAKMEKLAYFLSLFIWVYVKLKLLSQHFPKYLLTNIYQGQSTKIVTASGQNEFDFVFSERARICFEPNRFTFLCQKVN